MPKRKPTQQRPTPPQPPKKVTPSAAASIHFLNNTSLHLSVIFLFACLLYANTLTHSYTLDDEIVIRQNDFTQKGLAGVPDLLGNDTFLGFFKTKKNLVAGGRYRPLSLVTFAIEYQFFGESPFISHLLNVLLYGGVGVVLYLFLLQLFNPQHRPDHIGGYFLAFATTVLFVAHPLHTEAVANIKGRDEILSLLGSLAAGYFAMKSITENGLRNGLLAAGCLFLGLLSKENAITFLAVIPLAMYYFSPAKIKQIGLTTGLLLGAAVVFLVIRSSILGEASSLSGSTNLELMNNPFLKWTGSQYIAFTPAERLATIIYTLGVYLWLHLLPYPLTHDYYPRHIEMMNFGDWQVSLTLLLYLALGVYALLRFTKKDPISFAILYFFATLSIVSNVVFPIGTNMGERFMFMPSIGICLIAAVGLQKLTATKPRQWQDLKLALPIAAVVLVVFSGLTIARNFAWKDNYTLFSTDIKISKNSAKLNNTMGGETIAQAILPENQARKEGLLREAVQYLQKAIELHPTYANAYVLMGNAHVHLAEYAKAIEFYNYVQQITQDGATDYNNAQQNRGFAYGEWVRTALEGGRFQEVINVGQTAIQGGYGSEELYGRVGVAYGSTNQPLLAIEMFKKVLEINPNSAQGNLNLGFAYKTIGEDAQGDTHLNKAYQLDPSLQPK